jgi:Outer membrane protein/protective antigen OMA87
MREQQAPQWQQQRQAMQQPDFRGNRGQRNNRIFQQQQQPPDFRGNRGQASIPQQGQERGNQGRENGQNWRGNMAVGNGRDLNHPPYVSGRDWGQFKKEQNAERRDERQQAHNYWKQMTSVARQQQFQAFNRGGNFEDQQGNWDRNRRSGASSSYGYIPYNGFRSYSDYAPVYDTYNNYNYYNNYTPYSGYSSYVPYSYDNYSSYYDPYAYTSSYGYDPYNGYSQYYGYDPYAYSNYYGYDPYSSFGAYNSFGSGFGWKQTLLSIALNTLLNNVLDNGSGYNGGYYDNSYAGYDPYSYNNSYGYDPYGYSSTGYYSSGYDSSGYNNYYDPNAYDQYNSYDSYNYDPYGYNSYSYDPYSYDPTAYYTDEAYYPSYNNGLFDQLPIGSLLGMYSGGSLTSILRQAISYGYDRGYTEGQYVREYRLSDNYYQNPYSYQPQMFSDNAGSYDAYNQGLSQGYDLGYQDAVYGKTQYDPYNGGGKDLVSLVLNNVVNRSSIF